MSKIIKLVPPCSYQGGKQRLSKQIVDIIIKENKINEDTKFFDLCCGSGAISLELINRGAIHPSNITMVDNGCFGEFWNSIANDEFDLNVFKSEVDKLPNKEGCKMYLQDIANRPINKDLFLYHYLLLQSGSFGSKALWADGDKWKHHGFRDYWMPTETSVRRSPCNPMQPNPNVMYERLEMLTHSLGGIINAVNCDISVFIDLNRIEDNSIVYIDPPYMNTTGYKDSFDIVEVIDQIKSKRKNISLYVSEGVKLSENAIDVRNGKKGNITGNLKKKQAGEWLNNLQLKE